jgi:hypothetical protein
LKLSGTQIMEMSIPVPGSQLSPMRQLVLGNLPALLSLRIARLASAIGAEFVILDQVRNRLAAKHGEEKAPHLFEVPPDRVPAFMAEWQEVAKQEFVIPGERIRVTESDMANLNVSPLAIVLLEPVIAFGDCDTNEAGPPAV